MKVLFGMDSEKAVINIVNLYEKKYGEKIEYKIAFYLGQFIKEIEKGDYDRAVLKEDLGQVPNKNYAEADKQSLEIIEKIVNADFEVKNLIFLASERRHLGDSFLARLFFLNVYTTLTGTDRTIGKVCAVIKKPLTRKEVKDYYIKNPLDPDGMFNPSEVNETEIMHIKTYYRNMNGDTSQYCTIFDKIASQYTVEQMQVIISQLPQDVRDYLAANSESYKNIMSSAGSVPPQPASPQSKSESVIPNKANDGGVQIQDGTKIADEIVVSKDDSKSEKAKEIEPQVIVKEVPKEIIKEVVKEVPVEVVKEVPKEKIMYQVKEKKIVEQHYDVPEDYKKTVIFVGAPKTGTTFCINAIGTYLAKKKIKTALVDMTRKRDLYTIYTYDNTGKRNIAAESLKYASAGKNEPLVYDKLSVYTAVPGEDRKSYVPNVLVETISKNNNVVLIDADFSTPVDYFRLAQDIYIVQDMNVLNIQQITMFLRELKQRGIGMDKIKIIINKFVDCSLTTRDIIDGIATYTSYDLKMFDELFNPKRVQYFILPFDVENYTKYVEMVFKYSNKFSSFTQEFQENLDQVINSIYPTRGRVSVKEQPYTEEPERRNKNGFGLFKKK